MNLPPFFRLEAFARIDSTNDAAKARALEGAPEGTLIAAEEQARGRGRGGRGWVSARGNLHASLVLRPQCSARDAAQLGFAAALAVFEAAESVLSPQAPLSLKWPNDVLLGGAKFAGILLESKARDDGALEWLVVGIGVNLVSSPTGTEFPATNLAAHGAGVTAEQFLPILAGRLLAWYEAWRARGFAALRDPWLARAHRPGARLRVRTGARFDEGRFAGLDAEGRLLFDGPMGRVALSAADVFPAGS
jgi:BirA family transcriptional regulator, biotin operon repressor / biotin---[acetyl-CoA-carboxylase] ligase